MLYGCHSNGPLLQKGSSNGCRAAASEATGADLEVLNSKIFRPVAWAVVGPGAGD